MRVCSAAALTARVLSSRLLIISVRAFLEAFEGASTEACGGVCGSGSRGMPVEACAERDTCSNNASYPLL